MNNHLTIKLHFILWRKIIEIGTLFYKFILVLISALVKSFFANFLRKMSGFCGPCANLHLMANKIPPRFHPQWGEILVQNIGIIIHFHLYYRGLLKRQS